MSTENFDAIVIGAGIAGATVAAHLAADRQVALIEAEEAAGYHSTGRSAAIWILNYGPPDVRVLTGLSRSFFENPPEGFADGPILNRRPVLFLAPPDQVEALGKLIDGGSGLREAPLDEVQRMVPALRPDYAAAAAIEEDAFDMDVAQLHQGFLRQLRARGGRLALRSRAGRIAQTGQGLGGRDERGHQLSRARGGERGGCVGRRGGGGCGGAAARAGAEAAHGLRDRPRALHGAGLADGQRREP